MKEARPTDAEKQLLDRIRDKNSTQAEISSMYRVAWQTGSRQPQVWRDIDGAIAYKWGLDFSNTLSDWASKATA